MDNETKDMFTLILSKLDGMDKRLDSMDQRLDGMDKRFDGIDKRLDGMDKKIDNNHREVMGKLKVLEDNQTAVKNYIINADDTFKKVEEDHKFIEKLKNVVNS